MQLNSHVSIFALQFWNSIELYIYKNLSLHSYFLVKKWLDESFVEFSQSRSSVNFVKTGLKKYITVIYFET